MYPARFIPWFGVTFALAGLLGCGTDAVTKKEWGPYFHTRVDLLEGPPKDCAFKCEPCSSDDAADNFDKDCKNGCVAKEETGGAQIHEGSDGIFIPDGQNPGKLTKVGTLDAEQLGGVSTWREAYWLDEHDDFRKAESYTLVKLSPSFNMPGAQANGDYCGAGQGKCKADDTYNYQAVPDSKTLAKLKLPPAGAVRVFTVENHSASQKTTPPTPHQLADQTDCGRLFREVSVLYGQDRWVEHWVLQSGCLPPGDQTGPQVDLVMKEAAGAETTLVKFLEFTEKNLCDASKGQACRYAQVQFDWTER